MDMVNKMVSTATRNSTLLEIRKASTELGADATFLERIPDPKVPKQINISDLKQEIYESAGGKEMSADALDVLDDVLGTLDDVYTQFELGKANQKKGETWFSCLQAMKQAWQPMHSSTLTIIPIRLIFGSRLF